MSSHPPHLPKKFFAHAAPHDTKCTMAGVFVGLCALTAIAMSMALFAWYIPTYVSYYVPAGVQRTIAVPEVTTVDPLFIKDLESKMVQIHRGNSEAPPSTISDRSLLAQAMLLSSDGWIAFAGTDVTAGDNLFALDTNGSTYALTHIVKDEVSHIQYAKITGDGFRVMPIETGEPSASMYVKDGNTWSAQLVARPTNLYDDGAVYVHLPSVVYPVTASTGSIAIAANGGALGFVSDGHIIPAWWVQESLHAVLSGTPIVHTVFPYMYEPVYQVYNGEQKAYRAVTGLEIVTSPYAASSSTLAVGDVIVRLSGESVRPATIAEQIQRTDGPLVLDIYRSGSIVSVVLE